MCARKKPYFFRRQLRHMSERNTRAQSAQSIEVLYITVSRSFQHGIDVIITFGSVHMETHVVLVCQLKHTEDQLIRGKAHVANTEMHTHQIAVMFVVKLLRHA